jgi:hypothetical protein
MPLRKVPIKAKEAVSELRWANVAAWLLMLPFVTACLGSPQSGLVPQASNAGLNNPLSDTTIFIIRHAEKPEVGSGLSSEGRARARAYVKYFQDFRLDGQPIQLDYLVAADDSEHSQRPRQTLEPLAQGKTILICWHHHEIPELLKALGCDPGRLLPQGDWPSQQFAWMLQVRYDHQGKVIRGQTKRIKEHLMADD